MKTQNLAALKKQTLELAALLGLTDWEIDVQIGDAQSWCVTNECRASCHYRSVGRSAMIVYSPLITIERHDIIHELLHLLFAEFELVRQPGKTIGEISRSTEHRIIIRLENLL